MFASLLSPVGRSLSRRVRPVRGLLASVAMALVLAGTAPPAEAQVTAFRQAVAETAARDDALAAFYRDRGFEGIWTGTDAAAVARRNALLTALSTTRIHGLPEGRYDPQALVAQLQAARTPADRGRMEVELSRLLLRYARDIQTGILEPGKVVPLIHREVPLRDGTEILSGFAGADPAAFLRTLPPASPEYARLLRARMQLDRQLETGGWGAPVPDGRYEAGSTGAGVIALRNRLIAMGHLGRSATRDYDAALADAVRAFQDSVGLTADGIAGGATLAEINEPLEARLQSVLVAMERERWTNMDLGKRHVLVNLTDFSATIVDDDRVTFRTRSVIGAEPDDRQTPEFSDVMEYMVINPSWYVPRSIIVNEYLPKLQRDRNAVSQLLVTDRSGREIDRRSVDFSRYTTSNFPYSMRQPPSDDNALGLVKFLFPNRHNIYLHDTPAKSLFGREVRAFSHGCIRLNDPFDFAYALLAPQVDDPVAFFKRQLDTGREARVNLETPVPVHLVYRTAFTDVRGKLQFRDDIYGRDAQIWDALAREGVAISSPSS